MESTDINKKKVSLLIWEILDDLESIVRQEVALFGARSREAIQDTKRQQMIFFITGVFFIGALVLLIISGVEFLKAQPRMPIWGAYGITAAVLFLISSVLYSIDKKRLKQVSKQTKNPSVTYLSESMAPRASATRR